MKSKKEHYLSLIDSTINDIKCNNPHLNQQDRDRFNWIMFYAKELANECKDCGNNENKPASDQDNS